ncbi:MAG: four helix bundle protein [Muribaculaceae bacterium]|nr:four helix bundle protein [Muribaculaceae bacterium]
MKEDKNNLIVIETKAFAIRCIRLYQHLSEDKKEFVLSKQLLRSGTSVGANVREALRGQSKADFGSKMNIALKEICESEYWLELLYETDYITKEGFESMMDDCKQLIKILTAIVKTTFQK